MCLPFLSRKCPPFMITPATCKLQVPRGESFEPKSTPLNQMARRFVVGLNICLKPMQPLPTKRLPENGEKPPLHIATSVVRYESVVSKITGTEYTAHNLINVNDVCKLPILSANPITNVRSALQPFEARFEFIDSPRWTRPVPMKFAAPSHSRQEFISPCR
jgi:hypothetical protein